MGKFAVASGHALTSEAAADVLRAGGNAVDAVIAGAMIACVAEPVLASLLGGGFLTVAPVQGPTQVLDAFVQTPKHKNHDADVREVEVNFGETRQTFHCGAGTIATPGIAAGLFEARARYGRISMSELAAPAVAAASAGVITNAFQAEVFGYVAPIFRGSSATTALYSQDGHLLTEADVSPNPDMADVLDVMAREGTRFMQEGDVAKALLSLEGGHLRADDLKNYRPVWRTPLEISRAGAMLSLNPSPSLGGVQIALVLQALPEGADDTLFARCLFEVARIRKSRDLDHHPRRGEEILLDKKTVEDLRATLEHHQPATRGTTHISVIDAQGMGAALTLSNGEGCGLIAPGTGIMPNNMLGEDDLVPDGPHSWHEDVRLASMMCPIAMRKDGDVFMLGSGGSNRIRSALARVVLGLVDGNAGLEQAIAAPRIHVEADNAHTLDFEDIDDDARRSRLLQAFPHANVWPRRAMYFGGVHGVRRSHAGAFEAVGDTRRSGTALTE